MEVTVMEEADTDLIRKQEDDHEDDDDENDDADDEEEIPDCHATVYRVKPKVKNTIILSTKPISSVRVPQITTGHTGSEVEGEHVMLGIICQGRI